VKRPGQWDWSSHRAIAKDRDAPDWLSIDWILGDFAGAPEGARKAYRAFVAQGKRASSPWEHVRAQMYLGSQAFLTEMAERVSDLPVEQVPRAATPQDRQARRPCGIALVNQQAWAATASLTVTPRSQALAKTSTQTFELAATSKLSVTVRPANGARSMSPRSVQSGSA
jgi:hypothetical protein